MNNSQHPTSGFSYPIAHGHMTTGVRVSGAACSVSPRSSWAGLWEAGVHHCLVASAVVSVAVLPMMACAQSGNSVRWLMGGHAGKVNAVAFSPAGTLVASASDDATVKLWATNGALIKTLSTHPYQATALAFSPDGTRLAAGVYSGGYRTVSGQPIGGLGRVLLWQSIAGWTNDSISLLRTSTCHLGKVTSLAFSADATKLASGGAEGSNVVQWVSNGSVLARKAAFKTSEGPSIAWSVAFSPEGLLASACEDGTIRVWNSSWNQVWDTNNAHSGDVTAVAFSSDGSRMATASTDTTIRIWSTSTWSCLRVLTNHTDNVLAVAFAPDGGTLASASMDRTVRLWDVASGACVATAVGHAEGVTSLAFSPNGSSIVSGGLDNSVRLWSAVDGTLVREFTSHTDMIKAAAISPDGSLCVTISNDESVQVRRLLDGAMLRVLPGHTGCVNSVAFAPDSEVAATAGGPLDPTIRFWRIGDGSLIQTLPATSNGVTAMAFTADGTRLASAGDADERVIRLWDAASGHCVQTLPGHSNGVTALSFSPRGDLLASGGRAFDSTVKVWTLTNSSPIRTFSSHASAVEAVAFSPNGEQVASGSTGVGALKIHDIADGSSRTIGSDTNCVFFVAFSPDGSALASGCRDAIKLWDVSTGNLLETVTSEMTRVSCLAYSPNGNLIICGREDGTVLVSDNVLGSFEQEPLAFTSVVMGSDGVGRLEAAAQPRVHYVIEASTNLADWRFLSLAASKTNRVPIVDSSTNTGAVRFYRALTPP